MTADPLIEDQWEIIRHLMPADLDEHARRHGAMRRKRGQITTADQLLQVLLMHIGGGLSLEQTVARARQRGLAELNAMALHKRLCSAGGWFAALTRHVLDGMLPYVNQSSLIPGHRVRLLDATTISEPGSTGTDWRIHYSLRLPDMCCDFFELTDVKGAESAKRLPTEVGDIILMDRGYNDRQAIAQLMAAGAMVVLRFNSGSFPLLDAAGKPLNLLPKLRKLRIGQTLELAAWFVDRGKQHHQMRVCVLKKSPDATRRAERKILAKARSRPEKVRRATLEFAKYVVVLTNLPEALAGVGLVLELYRGRWQVELGFKRLKTLLELGHLPKKKGESSIAWMQGKILCALIIERLLCEARAISPWGYPV
jgi:hypothetical protein